MQKHSLPKIMLKFVIFIAILAVTTSLANNVPECSPSEK